MTVELTDLFIAQVTGLVENDIRARNMFYNFTNRDFEGDAENASEVKIVNPDVNFTDASVVDISQAANRNIQVPAPQVGDSTSLTMPINRMYHGSAFTRRLDDLEIVGGPGGPLIPAVLRGLVNSIIDPIDDDIRDYALASVPDANKIALGSDTDYVGTDGEPSTAAARKLFPMAIRQAASRYRAANLWKLGEREHQPIMFVGNAMLDAMNIYIDEDRPSDALVNQFVGSDNVQIGGFFGTWKDIPIFGTNRLNATIDAAGSTANPGTSGKAHHRILVWSPDAITAAFRTPVQSISGGNGVPVPVPQSTGGVEMQLGTLMYLEWELGRIAANPGFLYEFRIQAEA